MNKRFKRAVLDIETNSLLNPALDFLSKPLALKPHVRLWCIAIRDFDNLDDVVALSLDECTEENLKELLKETEEIIFHNGIGFDMVMLQLFNILKYKVGYESDTIFGDKPITFVDTLLLSKMLRPDRFGGHSVEAWGRTLGVPKIDFHEFEEYSDEMVEYCKGDTLTQAHIYQALLEEMGSGWEKIQKAYRMEIKLMDLTVRQELRGFHFDKPLAEKTVKDFTELLESIRAKVDPLLPERPLNKGEQKLFIPPKLQFKSNGDPSAVLLKFVDRVGGALEQEDGLYILEYGGNRFTLPYTNCIKTAMPGSIDNLDYLKGFLLDLGWDPIEWKERDLTKDSSKNKLSGSKLDDTILRYIDSTLNGPYKKYRLDLLGTTEEKLTAFLFSQKDKFSIKVPVSPLLRIGTEKKLCDNLKAMGEEADFALDVIKYLTFKHRKNSLAGGKSDEEGEPLSGYLSNIREDGRIGTPADTCGANGNKNNLICHMYLTNILS